MAYTPSGEGNFNVLYQLLAGADGQLKSDLLLNNLTGDQTEKNLYVEPFTNVCVWEKEGTAGCGLVSEGTSGCGLVSVGTAGCGLVSVGTDGCGLVS